MCVKMHQALFWNLPCCVHFHFFMVVDVLCRKKQYKKLCSWPCFVSIRGFIFRKMVYIYIYMYMYGIICFTCISVSSLVGRLLILMHVQHTIPYLYVQPCSWRWILRFESCRRHHKLKYWFRKGAFCWFVLRKCIKMYFNWYSYVFLMSNKDSRYVHWSFLNTAVVWAHHVH